MNAFMRWLEKRCINVEDIVCRVESFLETKSRPVFVGELSLFLGRNLEFCDELISVLLERGSIRHATTQEKLFMHANVDSFAYVFVCKTTNLV